MTNANGIISDMVTCRPRDVKNMVAMAIETSAPIMLHGAPGVGKSSIIEQCAAEAGLPCITLALTLLESVDLRGLPVVDSERDSVRWVPLGELPTAGKGVLNLDEINTADPSVMAAVMRLVLTGSIGDYQLPEGWVITATGNRVEDAAAANRMPTALADRFTHVTVETNIDDWSAWAVGAGVPMPLIAFLKYQPHHLSDFQTSRVVNTTPRGWGDVGLKYMTKDEKMQDMTVVNLSSGRVGQGPIIELRSFINTWHDLPDIDKVLSGEISEPIGMDKPAVKYAVSMAIAAKVSGDTLYNGGAYLKQIGPEYAKMMLLTALTIHDDLDRHPEYARTALSMGTQSFAA